MITIPFPAPSFKIQKRGDRQYIFDANRKLWVLLTEEEWVRQNFVAYLVEVLHYPKETIAIEKEIRVNGLKKRFDLLVYDAEHQPWMMIECKAPAVALSEAVLQQLLRYHMALPVKWLLITNGEVTTGWRKEGNGLVLLEGLPGWGE
ncbi:MAG TPA: type I restriction enzyme HsdR N-terminal domain-containing protein [Flavisolibacter sp.]|jgi:hypothetical protein|nr:type I restriction enzyme HsdR N-terminal domain-containing protein [Flavisolibacter sp.]